MIVTIGSKKWVVRWSHVKSMTKADEERTHSRGTTYCTVEELCPDGKRFEASGQAWCSVKDQYCKETGRRKSLQRALRGWERPARKAVWESYWAMKKGTES